MALSVQQPRFALPRESFSRVTRDLLGRELTRGSCTTPRRLPYLLEWHFLELPRQFGDPAVADVGFVTGAPLGGGDEADDSCCEPLEFDGSAETCVPGVACGIAARLEDCIGEPRVCAAALGESAPVVSPGESGTVVVLGAGGSGVLTGCCTRVFMRWPRPTPGETVNRPANTRTASTAATTTAAPTTPATTTIALRGIASRFSLSRDALRSALVRRRPSA